MSATYTVLPRESAFERLCVHFGVRKPSVSQGKKEAHSIIHHRLSELYSLDKDNASQILMVTCSGWSQTEQRPAASLQVWQFGEILLGFKRVTELWTMSSRSKEKGREREKKEEDLGFVVWWSTLQEYRILSSLKDIYLNTGEFFQVVKKLWKLLLLFCTWQ